MDTITFQKLKDIETRYAEVERSMSDPAVVQDPSAYQKLAKESKEISPIVERYRAYKSALGEITKVQEMAKSESDPDLREMAHEEIRSLEQRIAGRLDEQAFGRSEIETVCQALRQVERTWTDYVHYGRT